VEIERAKALERDRVGRIRQLVREAKVGVHGRQATERPGVVARAT
jgi:hypothetical protein